MGWFESDSLTFVVIAVHMHYHCSVRVVSCANTIHKYAAKVS